MNESQENLLDHYKNPRNFNRKLDRVDLHGKLQNLSCGDELEVFIKIEDSIISDISFSGVGCSISIGTASQLYMDLLGKSVDEVLKLKLDYPEELINIPLSLTRKKCAALSIELVQQTLKQSSTK